MSYLARNLRRVIVGTNVSSASCGTCYATTVLDSVSTSIIDDITPQQGVPINTQSSLYTTFSDNNIPEKIGNSAPQRSNDLEQKVNPSNQATNISGARSMDPRLYNLIRSVASESLINNHTHVSLYSPHARWTIPSDSHTTFWNGYCDLVGRENVCLAERPQEHQPLISLFTFKFNVTENPVKAYNTVFLQWICHVYQTVIREYFNVNTTAELELNVIVLESTGYDYIEAEQRFMILNLRLQFPHARINSRMQDRLVRPRVIQLLRNNNILAGNKSFHRMLLTHQW